MPLFKVLLVVIVLGLIASIGALFLRGFRFSDLKTDNILQTPECKAWLVVSHDYADKMAAYKTGLGLASPFGTYVYQENDLWQLALGVYATPEEAAAVCDDPNLPKGAVVEPLTINSKKYRLPNQQAIDLGASTLQTVVTIYAHLLEIRQKLSINENIEDMLLTLVQHSNTLKDSVTKLQNLPATDDDVFNKIIYSANQNILAISDVIFAQQCQSPFLPVVNTALLKCIFSLDNF